MKPTIQDIPYYEGDTFTIIVFPKDSAGGYIPLDQVADRAYFRVASQRGENPSWSVNARADITRLVEDGPYCIKCKIDHETSKNLENGYVYDIGFSKNDALNNIIIDRTTVVTGTFLVMSEVKVAAV